MTNLGMGKRPPVRVTIGDYTYRTTIAPMGGQYWIPLSAENRTRAEVAAGDDVEVDIQLDLEPREVTVPDDLDHALDAKKELRERFDRLSYTKRKELVRSVEDAKTDETRQRRIAKVITTISGGQA